MAPCGAGVIGPYSNFVRCALVSSVKSNESPSHGVLRSGKRLRRFCTVERLAFRHFRPLQLGRGIRQS
jgi:hypothetical protein